MEYEDIPKVLFFAGVLALLLIFVILVSSEDIPERIKSCEDKGGIYLRHVEGRGTKYITYDYICLRKDVLIELEK